MKILNYYEERYVYPKRLYAILIFAVLGTIGIFVFDEVLKFISPEYSIFSELFYYYLAFISIIFSYFFKKVLEKEVLVLSDEQRLIKAKRKFLNSILETLKLEINEDLKVSLENGEIEEANELIEDKINALNKLVETVTGTNTKSLRGTDISSVSAFYESTNSRIRTEIERIKLNANINMIIGVGASIVAIYLLYSTIQNHKIELLEIIPRATISILIEAFAFFFFSQYRKQQEEIKYWNNEKTNLDIKIFALSIAIDDEEIGTKDYMRNLITDLIKTERNIFGTTTQPKEEKPKEGPDDKKLYEDLISKIKDLAELLPKK